MGPRALNWQLVSTLEIYDSEYAGGSSPDKGCPLILVTMKLISKIARP